MSIQPRLRFFAILVISLFSLSACLQDSGDGNVTAYCALSTGSNSISFIVSSDTPLPNALSGRINDSIAFDECQGEDSYLYTIVRTGQNFAQVNIWLPPTAKPYDEYFDQDGVPYPDPSISYEIFGREYCDSDALSMSRGTTTLKWEAIHANGLACPTSGYSAVVR